MQKLPSRIALPKFSSPCNLVLMMMFLFGAATIVILSATSDAHPRWDLSMSLTACIEQEPVANEIQITGSAIREAAWKVSGFRLGLPSENKGSGEDYCALTLA